MIYFFLYLAASSEPPVADPLLYEWAPIPANCPSLTIRYWSLISFPSKKHSKISLTPSAYLVWAQTRYADGVREILECFFEGKEIRDQYLIVKDGQLAGMGAHSYSKGSATGGSEEAAKYKKK